MIIIGNGCPVLQQVNTHNLQAVIAVFVKEFRVQHRLVCLDVNRLFVFVNVLSLVSHFEDTRRHIFIISLSPEVGRPFLGACLIFHKGVTLLHISRLDSRHQFRSRNSFTLFRSLSHQVVHHHRRTDRFAKRDATVAFNRLRSRFNEVTNQVSTLFRNVQCKHIVLRLSTRVAKMIVMSHHLVGLCLYHVHTHQLQAVCATFILERNGLFAEGNIALCRLNVLRRKVKVLATVFNANFQNVGRRIRARRKVKRLRSPTLRRKVFDARIFRFDSVHTHWCFESGKYFIACQHRTTRITHHRRRTAGSNVVHGVNHRRNRLHSLVVLSRDVQVRAQIVRTVAQNGSPFNRQVIFRKNSLDSLTCKAFRTLCSSNVGIQFFSVDAFQLHVRSIQSRTIAQNHLKQFTARFQIHGLTAVEQQFAIGRTDKRSTEQIVFQNVFFAVHFNQGNAGLLLLRKDYSLRHGFWGTQ